MSHNGYYVVNEYIEVKISYDNNIIALCFLKTRKFYVIYLSSIFYTYKTILFHHAYEKDS